MTVESQLREQLAKQEQELAGRDKRIAELEVVVARHTDIYAAERQQADQARDERDEAVAQLAAERERAEKAEALLRDVLSWASDLRLTEEQIEKHRQGQIIEAILRVRDVRGFQAACDVARASLSQTKEGEG